MFQHSSHRIRLNLVCGVLLGLFVGLFDIAVLTLSSGRVEAQADTSSIQFGQTEKKQSRANSFYFYVSVGSSFLLHPGDFHTADWQDGLDVGLAGVYWQTERRSFFFSVERSGFSTATVLENPEIIMWRFIAGLSLSHPTRFLTPYASVGAGVVRQGLRRMFISDGSFRYTGAVFDFEWTTGPTLSGAVGTTINASSIVFPYGEVSYIGSRAAGVTIGRVTFRAGVALSPAKFAESIAEGFRKRGRS